MRDLAHYVVCFCSQVCDLAHGIIGLVKRKSLARRSCKFDSVGFSIARMRHCYYFTQLLRNLIVYISTAQFYHYEQPLSVSTLTSPTAPTFPSAGPTRNMSFIFSNILSWLRGLFFAKHLEVTIVGLQASGKTS